MAGITTYHVTGPSGLIRSYREVTPHATNELPDNVIALFATGGAGNVTVTTVIGDTVTLPIANGGYLPIEPLLVTAWTGAGTLYACLR